MKLYVMIIAISFCFIQTSYSQEDDGVVSLALPIRNSLTYNQFTINPSFSFVRQQYKYISITNKREWVQFEDAPQTYLVSYSGRFRENIGVGLGLFQQNYGVLTTFGGVMNFAYNARLNSDNNLTFGINLGAYKSGINGGSVVTNYPDPSLENIPSNFLLSVSPGINFGTAFLDFGISINNLVLYNINTSQLIENNPNQSLQAHMMYTGYMDSYGFFDQSKFTGIIKSEFNKENTIISGIAMLTVPKGIWAQVGYNSLYGASGGVGLNITNQISIEYNFEKALGDLTEFGPSHEISLAYKFINKEKFDYSSEDKVAALITTKKKKKSIPKSSNNVALTKPNVVKEPISETKIVAEPIIKKETDTIAKPVVNTQTNKTVLEKSENETAQAEKNKLEAEAKAAEEDKKIEEIAKAQAEAESKRLAALEQAKIEAELLAKAEADKKLAESAQTKKDTLLVRPEPAINLISNDSIINNASELELIKQDSILNPTDKIGISMKELTQLTEASKATQEELLIRLNTVIISKDKDLKDLKEENDLSEKGIYLEPKPFKSLTAENREIEALKQDLDEVIKLNNERIKTLDSLYEERSKIPTLENDVVYLYYQKALEELKTEQATVIRTKASLLSSLEEIKVATDFERKRRIKRAVYNNEEDRYKQDRAVLNAIKNNTSINSSSFNASDFDFGEKQSNNIKIIKNVNNQDNGFYIILAVHNDIQKRDEFLTKTVASGLRDVDFFYDVTSSKYYIYSKKYDSIEAANEAIKSKGNEPYNSQASIVKIEN